MDLQVIADSAHTMIVAGFLAPLGVAFLMGIFFAVILWWNS